MSHSPNRFRWWQFGLKSLLVLTLVGAVAASFVAQRRQSKIIADQNLKIAELSEEVDCTIEKAMQWRALIEVYHSMDLESPAQRNAFQSIRSVWHNEVGLDSHERRYLDERRTVSVEIFEGSSQTPGRNCVAVILDGQFVDCLKMRGCSDYEWREQDDGTLHLAHWEYITPLGSGALQRDEHVFAVTPTGFERISGKPRFGGGIFGGR